MSGRNKRSKDKIQMTKPEPPPFLQRIREQMVANEDVERREQADRKRKLRPGRPDNPDDDPTIVQLNDDDLTEEEYKRMKHEMETQYKLDNDKRSSNKHEELDVDALIESRKLVKDDDLRRTKISGGESPRNSSASKTTMPTAPSAGISSGEPDSSKAKKAVSNAKMLSYGSSSSSEEDE